MEENYHKEKGPKGQENEVRKEMGWMKRFWKGLDSWLFGSGSEQGGKYGSTSNVYFMDFPAVQERKLSTDQNAQYLLRNFSDSQCRAFAQESTSMMILIYCLFSASSNPVERDIARALLDSYKTVSLKFGVPITVTNQGNEK